MQNRYLELIAAGGERSVPAIRSLLNNDSPEVQLLGMRALVSMPEPSIPLLFDCLSHKNIEVAELAAITIARSPGDYQTQLADMLHSSNDREAWASVVALQIIGQESSTELMLKALETVSNINTRAQLIDSLAMMCSEEVKPFASEYLDEQRPLTHVMYSELSRARALKALGTKNIAQLESQKLQMNLTEPQPQTMTLADVCRRALRVTSNCGNDVELPFPGMHPQPSPPTSSPASPTQ
jgi:HEAT repeat protein